MRVHYLYGTPLGLFQAKPDQETFSSPLPSGQAFIYNIIILIVLLFTYLMLNAGIAPLDKWIAMTTDDQNQPAKKYFGAIKYMHPWEQFGRFTEAAPVGPVTLEK